MEAQIQALEGLIRSERGNLVRADQTQKSDHLKRNDRQWQVKLEAIDRTAEDQLDERSKTLRDQEEELDDVRAHHMFSRILSFLFVIVLFFKEKNVF